MKSLALLAVVALSASGGPALADLDEMYKAKNCFACHRIEANHLGPSFKSVAAKYAEDKGAAARLAQKIREGSVGVWGASPMPAQTQVTEAEAATLARWIMEVK